MQYVFEPLHLKYNLPKFKEVKDSQLVPKKPIDAPGQFSTCFLIHISSNRLHEEKKYHFSRDILVCGHNLLLFGARRNY